jgi:hypothetical protein
MDYSSPFTIKQSGRDAFNTGVDINDCPINPRTNANAIHWWVDGWKEAESAAGERVSIMCNGTNCEARGGVGHSPECEREHAARLAGI